MMGLSPFMEKALTTEVSFVRVLAVSVFEVCNAFYFMFVLVQI